MAPPQVRSASQQNQAPRRKQRGLPARSLLHNLTQRVHNANAREFQRDVDSDIVLHGCPPSPDAWGRLNVVTPFHHLSGDSHLHRSLGAEPITASSQFNLDESAIEAEAIRKSSADLELLDRMLSSLESRRNKALGCVAEYRASLAHQLRESADRVIDGKGVLRLEDAASERSTAA